MEGGAPPPPAPRPPRSCSSAELGTHWGNKFAERTNPFPSFVLSANNIRPRGRRPRMRWTRSLAALALAVALAPATALAQAGRITGIVTDRAAGQPVSDAT